jgi:hypothetical protein
VAKSQPVVFHSKFLRYELVRQPILQQPLATGGWQTVQKGVRYKFEPAPSQPGARGRGEEGEWVGVLTVMPGQDKLVDSDGWLAPGQEQGVERDVVEALMAHREFGQDFWLLGHEPGTLYPRPEEFRRDMIKASVALDEDALLELVVAEEKSHARQDLLRDARVTLEQVRQARAELEAAQAAAEAGKPAAKSKAAA